MLVALAVAAALTVAAAAGASATEPVLVTLAHSASQRAALAEALAARSDVSSPLYGRHMRSPEEVAAVVGATHECVAAVTTALEAAGAVPGSVRPVATRDAIRATLPDAATAAAWAAGLHGAQLPAGCDIEATYRARAGAPITSANSRRIAVSLRNNEVGDNDNDNLGTPNRQRESYGVPAGTRGRGTSDNLQMCWGPGTYGYLESDVQTYIQEFDVDASVKSTSRSGFPGTPGGDNFGEASLDVDSLVGISQGVHTIVANTNNTESTEETLGFGYAFLDAMVELSGSTASSKLPLPAVLSLSLGSVSANSCNMMCDEVVGVSQEQCRQYIATQRQVCMLDSPQQEQRIDTEFQKLGVRGTTIVAAAGDGGSHFSFEFFDNSNPVGKALNDVCCKKNFPTFPASSPHVLAVGGTMWQQGGTPQAPVAWTSGGSGFSWLFPSPGYQRTAVQKYLAAHNTSAGFPGPSAYAVAGRAYPDVAALADNVPMVMNGRSLVTGGTSASAPETAALVSLLNDARLAKGLPTLGFLNPRLYKTMDEQQQQQKQQQQQQQQQPPLFYDVTVGNSSCAINGCCSTGFPATPSWDAMTGWGSPLFPGLLAAFGTD